VEPRADAVARTRIEVDQGAPAVVGILAAGDEAVLLEVPNEAARGGQREVDASRELTNGGRPHSSDVGEQPDVSPTDRRRLAEQRHQVVR